jgi:hypothetical protein
VAMVATESEGACPGTKGQLRSTWRAESIAAALVAALLAVLLPSTGGCGASPTGPDAAIDLAPFRDMAKKAGCASERNRLFLIDRMLVFWDRVGRCPDFAYQQTLYGGTVDNLLCTYHDSIAGPVKACQDLRYSGMFEAIIANLDKADLGLGSAHQVEPIPF